jgi:hypothetical protein
MDLTKTGWILGLTYGTKTPGGIDYQHCIHLLDEMHHNRMNLLSVMMQSYGFFDPMHDGYAWPVQHPKLQCYLDTHAINANPKTEFLTKIIDAAQDRGINIELTMNWGIWNNQIIKQSYPDAILQQSEKTLKSGKNPDHWVHCPDSPGAMQLGIDEVCDLLRYYHHKNVTRFSFERLSYVSGKFCHCYFTKENQLKMQQNHPELKKASENEIKRHLIKQYMKEYIKQIKKVRPDIQVGVSSRGTPEWGHNPQDFPEVGIEFCEPHTIQFKMSVKEIFKIVHYLSPNHCDLHFDVRDQAPTNYPIWIKTPKIIKKTLQEISTFQGSNLTGILFFNEASVSNANRQAVYDALKDNFMLVN